MPRFDAILVDHDQFFPSQACQDNGSIEHRAPQDRYPANERSSYESSLHVLSSSVYDMVDDWTMARVFSFAVPAKRYDVINTGIELALKIPYFSMGFSAPGGADPRFSRVQTKHNQWSSDPSSHSYPFCILEDARRAFVTHVSP